MLLRAVLYGDPCNIRQGSFTSLLLREGRCKQFISQLDTTILTVVMIIIIIILFIMVKTYRSILQQQHVVQDSNNNQV